MTGTVYRWNPLKGIGNISAGDGSTFFFHHSAVHGKKSRVNFKLGEHVTFDAIHTNKQGEDDIAINVTPLD